MFHLQRQFSNNFFFFYQKRIVRVFSSFYLCIIFANFNSLGNHEVYCKIFFYAKLLNKFRISFEKNSSQEFFDKSLFDKDYFLSLPTPFPWNYTKIYNLNFSSHCLKTYILTENSTIMSQSIKHTKKYLKLLQSWNILGF